MSLDISFSYASFYHFQTLCKYVYLHNFRNSPLKNIMFKDKEKNKFLAFSFWKVEKEWNKNYREMGIVV